MIEDALLDAIREAKPERLLVIGKGPVAAAAEAYKSEQPATTVQETESLPAAGRYDLTLIGEVVGVWPAPQAEQLLAALRDRYSQRILIAATEGAWPLTDYLALGFERRGEPADGIELFWYDADRFNPEREWNNPDHWANPENFKRYRW